MKTKLSRTAQWLMTAIISLLGFSACSDEEKGMMCMYGTPTFDYQADGRVVDEEGNPIEGIQVKVSLRDVMNRQTEDGGTIYSGKDGSFKTDKYFEKMIFSLTATDVDGAKNGGEFDSQEIRVDMIKPTYEENRKEGDSWYFGVQKYEDIEIVMTEKSTEEE